MINITYEFLFMAYGPSIVYCCLYPDEIKDSVLADFGYNMSIILY